MLDSKIAFRYRRQRGSSPEGWWEDPISKKRAKSGLIISSVQYETILGKGHWSRTIYIRFPLAFPLALPHLVNLTVSAVESYPGESYPGTVQVTGLYPPIKIKVQKDTQQATGLALFTQEVVIEATDLQPHWSAGRGKLSMAKVAIALILPPDFPPAEEESLESPGNLVVPELTPPEIQQLLNSLELASE